MDCDILKGDAHMLRVKHLLIVPLAMLLVVICLLPAFAVTVKNPSFETPVTLVSPGYCDIPDWTGWTTMPPATNGTHQGYGINNLTIKPFADNGTIPDGSNVAFIQKESSISQTIDGFEANVPYVLSYRENCRSAKVSTMLTVTLADAFGNTQILVPIHKITPTKGAYLTKRTAFMVPESGSYTLSFVDSIPAGQTDSAALVDDIQLSSDIPCGTVQGKVFDSITLAGVAGATVVVNGSYTTTTDDNGNYSCNLVLPGSFTVSVSGDKCTGKSISGVMPDPVATVTADVSVCDLSTPSATVIDTFERTMESGLGTTEPTGTIQLPWVTSGDTANVSLTGSTMKLSPSTAVNGVYLGGNFAPADFDTTVSVVWVPTNVDAQWFGIAYRQPTLDYTGGGYYVYVPAAGGSVLLKRGTTTLVTATLKEMASPYILHTYRIQVIGTSHKVWLDGTKIIDITDSSYTSGGNFGMICDGQNDVEVDDFSLSAYQIPSWTVTGKVTNSTTAQPVPGATVKVLGFTTTTDSNGVYSVSVPGASSDLYIGGSPNITWDASARGYVPLSYSAGNNITSTTITQDLSMIPKIPVSIGDARTKAEGDTVYLQNVIVTGKYNGYVYVEGKDRVAGIKVKSASVALNDDIDIDGTISKENGENYVVATATTKYGTYIIAPLGTSERALSGTGLSTNGLLMKTWGKVTSIDPNGAFMYINDGSSDAGIKVSFADTYDLTLPTSASVGDNVSVAGIATYDTDGKTLTVHPRSGVDIVNAAYAQVVVHESDFGSLGDGFNWARSSYVNPDDWTDHTSFTDQGIYCEQTTNQWYNRIRCWLYGGTPLTDITCLKYAGFVSTEPTGMTNATFELQMCIDMNGDGTIDDVLHYEPYKNKGLAFAGIPGTWQMWDALNGLWSCEAASDSSIASTLMTRTDPKSLSYYLSNGVAAGATATLITDENWRGVFSFNTAVNDAPSAWNGFTGTLGCFVIKTSNGGTIYSFAP